jgi:anti-sigma factor (TIGR02949 family)
MKKTMKCEEVIAQLYQYLDREVDAELSKNIDHHLHDCRECFNRAEFEKKLRSRVSTASETEMPDAVKSRLNSLIKKF